MQSAAIISDQPSIAAAESASLPVTKKKKKKKKKKSKADKSLKPKGYPKSESQSDSKEDKDVIAIKNAREELAKMSEKDNTFSLLCMLVLEGDLIGLKQEMDDEESAQLINYWTNEDPPLLHQAAEEGYLAIVTWLIEKAKADATINPPKWGTFVHSAAVSEQIAILEYAIKQLKINVDISGVDGRTPLGEAFLNSESLAAVRWLVAAGANIQHADMGGNTILHHAMVRYSPDFVKYIIEELKVTKEFIEKPNAEGLTALHRAILASHSKECENPIKYLIVGAKVNVNVKVKQTQWTPLMYAAQKNCLEVAKCFFEYQKVDICATNADGKTALQLAEYHGHKEMASFLRKKLKEAEAAALQLSQSFGVEKKKNKNKKAAKVVGEQKERDYKLEQKKSPKRRTLNVAVSAIPKALVTTSAAIPKIQLSPQEKANFLWGMIQQIIDQQGDTSHLITRFVADQQDMIDSQEWQAKLSGAVKLAQESGTYETFQKGIKILHENLSVSATMSIFLSKLTPYLPEKVSERALVPVVSQSAAVISETKLTSQTMPPILIVQKHTVVERTVPMPYPVFVPVRVPVHVPVHVPVEVHIPVHVPGPVVQVPVTVATTDLASQPIKINVQPDICAVYADLQQRGIKCFLTGDGLRHALAPELRPADDIHVCIIADRSQLERLKTDYQLVDDLGCPGRYERKMTGERAICIDHLGAGDAILLLSKYAQKLDFTIEQMFWEPSESFVAGQKTSGMFYTSDPRCIDFNKRELRLVNATAAGDVGEFKRIVKSEFRDKRLLFPRLLRLAISLGKEPHQVPAGYLDAASGYQTFFLQYCSTTEINQYFFNGKASKFIEFLCYHHYFEACFLPVTESGTRLQLSSIAAQCLINALKRYDNLNTGFLAKRKSLQVDFKFNLSYLIGMALGAVYADLYDPCKQDIFKCKIAEVMQKYSENPFLRDVFDAGQASSWSHTIAQEILTRRQELKESPGRSSADIYQQLGVVPASPAEEVKAVPLSTIPAAVLLPAAEVVPGSVLQMGTKFRA